MAINYINQSFQQARSTLRALNIDFQIGTNLLLQGNIDGFEIWALGQMQSLPTHEDRINFVNQVVERLERTPFQDLEVKDALIWEANSQLGTYALRAALPIES